MKMTEAKQYLTRAKELAAQGACEEARKLFNLVCEEARASHGDDRKLWAKTFAEFNHAHGA